MRAAILNPARGAANVVLVIISMLLSINLFWQLGADLISQVILSTMAGSLEIIKVWAFIHGVRLIQVKRTIMRVGGIYLLLCFFVLACLSIVASVGYSLTTVEKQSFSVRSENYEITLLEDEIESNKRQIDIIQGNATGLEFSAVERGKSANEQVSELQSKNRALGAEIVELRNTKANDRQAADDIFTALGSYASWDGYTTMKILLLGLAVMLEVMIATTSPRETEGKKRQHRAGLLDYVDVGIPMTPGALKSLAKASNDLGVPVQRLKHYRALLNRTRYKNEPLVRKEKNAWVSNFSREEIASIVKQYL